MIETLHLNQEPISMDVWVECGLDKSNRWHENFNQM
jgi:hypothetical protein